MALTFSLTGLQTQCDAVAAAIDAEDYVTARAALAKATLVLVGLPEEAKADGAVVKMRTDLDKISAILENAASVSSDRRRLIRVGLTHQSQTRRV